jgi:hypothetical protein
MIGLGFEPVPGRDVPDIAGTFWLEEDSGQLRTVEFRYVEAGRPFRMGGFGQINFQALADGPWVVDSWWIRWPLTYDRQVRYQETGGEMIGLLPSLRAPAQ